MKPSLAAGCCHVALCRWFGARSFAWDWVSRIRLTLRALVALSSLSPYSHFLLPLFSSFGGPCSRVGLLLAAIQDVLVLRCI